MANEQQAITPYGANPNPQQQRVPGPVEQAARRAGIESAYAFFGSAAAELVQDPAVAEPIKNIGTRISEAMQERWFKKEWENFQSSHGQEFQQNARSIAQSLGENFNNLNQGYYVDAKGNTVKIDPTSEEAGRLRDNMLRQSLMDFKDLSMDYMEAAGKYRTNPYVNQSVQNMLQMTTSTIQEMTGPSQALASELKYAEMDLTRAQAEAARRVGKEKGQKEPPNAMDLWARLGPQKFLTEITTKHTDWLDTYYTAAEARIKADLMQKHPEYRDNPDLLTTAVNTMSDRILKLAAGMFAQTNIPGSESVIKSLPGGDQYFPALAEYKAPTKITADMTKEDKSKFVEDALTQSINYMDKIIRTDKPKKYTDAVDRTVKEYLVPALNEKVSRETKGGESLYRDVLNKVRSALSNEEEVSKTVESVGTTYLGKDYTKGTVLFNLSPKQVSALNTAQETVVPGVAGAFGRAIGPSVILGPEILKKTKSLLEENKEK